MPPETTQDTSTSTNQAAVDRGDFLETPPVDVSAEELEDVGLEPKEPAKEEVAEPKAEEAKEEPAKEEAEKPEPKKDIKIPKARFDELNNKQKAKIAQLEARVAEFEKQSKGASPVDLTALEAQLDAKSDEYGKLVADGDLDKAKTVLQEINKINRSIAKAELQPATASAMAESQHQMSLAALVDVYKEAFPVFDDASTDYNEEYVKWVASKQYAFERGGSSPAEALREAVELAVIKYGLTVGDEEAPVTSKKTAAQERKETAVGKAVKASNGQPPKMDKVGTDSDKAGLSNIGIEDLKNYDKFSKLREDDLQRMRGDFL